MKIDMKLYKNNFMINLIHKWQKKLININLI